MVYNYKSEARDLIQLLLVLHDDEDYRYFCKILTRKALRVQLNGIPFWMKINETFFTLLVTRKPEIFKHPIYLFT